MIPTTVRLLVLGAALAAPAPATPAGVAPDFAARRASLMSRIPPGGVAVLHAAAEPAQEVGGSYRQDSNFWYLTGFGEPGAIAVLRPRAAAGGGYVLFVQPRDFASEQWTGWRAGVEGARSEHGADEAYPDKDLWDKLPELLRGAGLLLYDDGGDSGFRQRLLSAWNAASPDSAVLRPAAPLDPLVHQMRLIKDPAEQALVRRAAGLSADAHRAAMRVVRPGRHEYDLEAAMLATCRAGGGARMAYPPIVGSGRNSVILHYDRNDKRLEAGEMIVNDTGCEYGMYASDVTRSYPVSGRFSPEQKAVYEIVLAAQKAGLDRVRPGTALADVHRATVEVITDGLLRLGLLAGDREEVIRTRAFQKLYPHGCCHWIGLGVHDAGSYGYPEGVARFERYMHATTKLEPGMVLTVEPGIYIPESATTDRRYWNIGARIEDTVLVTPSGAECLSCGAPREIEDVEKEIAGRRR
jgi:Xaa-Pro aminopeptidase